MISAVQFRWPVLLTSLLPALVVCGGCGKKTGVIGQWEGPMDVGPSIGIVGKPAETTFHIILNIRSDDGRLGATFMSREEDREPVPADTVELNNSTISVKISKRKEVYEGTLSSDGSELRGSIKQAPYEIPLNLRRSAGS